MAILLTLWLSEVAFLNTSGQSAIEYGVELLAINLDVVVGENIFLQCLTARQRWLAQATKCMRDMSRGKHDRGFVVLTWNRFSP